MTDITLIDGISKSLTSRIQKLTDPLGDEIAIWKFVHDEANRHDVNKIAEQFLVNLLRNHKRALAREEEKKAREQAREAERLYWSSPEGIAEMAEMEARWEERVKDEDAKRKKELEHLFEPITEIHGVSFDSVTRQQFDLVAVGFPVADLIFGDEAKAEQRSFRKPSHEWLNERGHKGARSWAVQEADRRDDRTFGHWRGVTSAIREFEKSLKVKWTQDLLSTTFRVDGEEVSWGNATVQQHKLRAEQLTKQAVGTLETVSLHTSAIQDLEQSGAICLNEKLGVIA